MTDQVAQARIDGRRARGERTRLNVLEALLALVEEGQLRPTAQEVAERAGVALRTVYHHFEDVEALRRLAFDLQVGRNREALRPVDTSQPVAERCRQVAHQLRRFHEAISPIRRAVMLEERSSQQMADVLRRARAMRRQFVEQAFVPETEGLEVAERRAVLDALDVTTSWQSWYYLRASLGRGAQVAERVLAFQLEQLLVGAGEAVDLGQVGEGRAMEMGEEGRGFAAGTEAEGERAAAAEGAEVSTRTMVGQRDRRRRGTRSGPGR
jgi:TetR/AcrR family transcriptional regulator of autoinduction and epiphytic fitness